MNIYQAIKDYVPYNVQEEKDKQNILSFLQNYDDIFYRTNLIAHMTASAWVVNEKMDKVLMAYHRLYDSWAWLGGHCDGDEDTLAVAIKEVKEEAGIEHVKAVSEDIFSLEVLSVDGHMKKGEYVPTHLHLNVTYLLQADENDVVHIKEDENTNVAWFNLDEALEKVSEPWFIEHIYSKLNKKLRDKYENN